MMKICPKCTAAFDDAPKYCSVCGTKLPDSVLNTVMITEEGIQEVPPENSSSQPSPSLQLPEEVHSEEYVKQNRRNVWKFVSLLAIAFALVLSFVLGLSWLHNLRQKAVVKIKDSVMVMESDNDELVGVSRSGKMVKLKTESSIVPPSNSSALAHRSGDGSKIVFLDSQKTLRLFDGSRFTTVAEDVLDYRISFDGSGVAYVNVDNDLFLYRKGNAQRIASRVRGVFGLSPDGESLTYVREEGETQTAFFFNGKERVIAKEAVPFAISNGGTYVYYCSAKGVVYVQKGGNQDSRQKLADSPEGEYYFNVNGEQVLLNDGTNTYFSEYGGERAKIASVPLVFLSPQSLAPHRLSLNQSYVGVKNLKDRFYVTRGQEGKHVYHLGEGLELASLIKNIQDYALMPDGQTLIYQKNQNLYYINLRNTEKGESKIASDVRGWRVSGDGKRVLFVDEEGESWFATLGREPRRITAETIDTSEVIPLESGFVYLIDGSLYYTNGGKGSKISGLSDDVQSLGGDWFVVLVECRNGDLFISTNGKKYTKYVRK